MCGARVCVCGGDVCVRVYRGVYVCRGGARRVCVVFRGSMHVGGVCRGSVHAVCVCVWERGACVFVGVCARRVLCVRGCVRACV